MSKQRFEPCPYCGSSNVTIASAKHELGRLLFFGMCMGCGSKGPSKLTERDAASEWNRRAEAKVDD